MKLIRDGQKVDAAGLVATIGFFDGVHRGHRFLIDQLKEVAGRYKLPSAVITFSQHPRKVLHADYQPELLNSLPEKIDLLASMNIDYCIVLDFTLQLANLSAQQFLSEVLSADYHVKALVVGYDHRFGHNREDGFEQYVSYGEACGMDVIKAASLEADEIPVSSSLIRRCLKQGKVEDAALLLSYPYSLKGHVVSGYQMGRKLGFPTANITVDEPQKLIPAIGVYAVYVFLNGQKYKGMLYIGSRPTLHNGTNVSIEVYILDFSGSIYQEAISVLFIRRIRDDIHFDTLNELQEQLKRDEKTVREML